MNAPVQEPKQTSETEVEQLLRDPARLAALERYGILDTLAETPFDDLALLAAQMCGAPVALVSLVAADREFHKARVGPRHHEAPLNRSCSAAALGSADIHVIPDLTVDRRSEGAPSVAGRSGFGFYAGAPLRTFDGHVLGTLCVFDYQPRPNGLMESEAAGLRALARQVMALIERGRAVAERDATLKAQRRMVEQQVALLDTQATISQSAGKLDIILDALVAGAMRAIETAEGGVIELRTGDHLTYRSAQGTLGPHAGTQVPLNRSLAGACFLSGEPMLCPDALVDPRTTPDLARRLAARACLLVPLSQGGTIIGVLKLQSSKAGVFTARDLQVVRLFAGAAAVGFAEVSDAAARRAAHAAETRYRAIFESAIDFAIVVMDLDGLVTNWNTGAERVLGWSRGEMIGRPAALFFTPEDRAADILGRELTSALASGRGVDERWHLRKDGRRFWANGEMMTLRADDGEAIGFLKILRDRTAQHEAEQQIISSERRLRFERGLLEAVVQQAPVGIAIAFAEGEHPIVNARMQAMIGPDQDGGRMVPEGERRSRQRDALDDAMTGALRRGEVLSNQVVLREDAGSGEVRHWTVSSTPVRDDHGQVLAAVSIVVDVEDQRRALQALQDSEERLALAVQASGSMGWWDWDVKRGLIYANAAFARAYGVDPVAAAEGLPLAAFTQSIHPDDRAHVEGRIAAVLSEGGDFGEEYRLGHGHDVTWVYARGRCYHDGAGRPARFPGVTIDVTARKAVKAAADARQAQLNTVIEAVPVGILLAEAPSGRITVANKRAADMLGLLAGESLADRPVGFHEDGRPVEAEEWPLARIAQGDHDRACLEVRYRQSEDRHRWLSMSGEAVRDAAGITVGVVVAIDDIEDRKQAEANQAILNSELSHRMKNTLAMVQAVAGQTLRNAPDLPAAREALDSRLIALGKAHDLLMAGNAASADVAAVIQGALDLHDDRQGRIQASGPTLPIGPSAALSLALIIHELGTNAVKYGALSVGQGRVAVTWAVQPGSESELFALTWREQGGPAVVAPTRKGFGSRLIERGFGAAFGSAADLSYASDGVVCKLAVPVSRFMG